MNGDKNPILIPKPEYPLDYKEFTDSPTQEQNVGEELAQVEDLLSSEEASNQEPDSAAAPSSQVLDYEEFKNPTTQKQNVGEKLARVEDLLSSEEASNQEPDSAAAPSSQSAPPMDLVGDIYSVSPLQEVTIQDSLIQLSSFSQDRLNLD